MNVLANCEPKKVFEFFELLSSVPHGSGNTKRISDVCVRFAQERGLAYYQDELNNVIIYKPATPGYESAEPIIIQGHLDMVCAKEEDCPLDMEKDPIKLAVDGDFLHAVGTSLGADNAIAVAMAMAVLDSGELPHPPIEAVFTTEEETGMAGAKGLDVSRLKGKKLWNLDCVGEGIFTVGCAGGCRAACALPLRREALGGGSVCYRVEISGLLGGHSGGEIHLGRGSSNQLMGRLLYSAGEKTALRLCAMSGGQADNAIPSLTTAVVAVPQAECAAFEELVAEYDGIFRKELAMVDPDVSVRAEPASYDGQAVCREDTATALFALLVVPYHVQSMSHELPGLVQTSLNMGILRLEENELRFSFAVRSSVASEKAMLCQRLGAIMERVGGTLETYGDYPAWPFRRVSPFRELILEVYERQNNKKPSVFATHGGLECGLFSDRMPGLDCISCGPDLFDVHSPREHVSISSVGRMWKLVCEVLRLSK